jgi:hypothetical protein
LKLQSGKTALICAASTGAFLLFFSISGCRSGAPSGGLRICTLTPDKRTFICDVEFMPEGGSCQPGVSVRREFLTRMTNVSLEMLYLDREPGGQGPFRYNDAAKTASRIEVVACRSGCECRLQFTDSSLEEIFYDSAGCRTNSRFQNHPLYFRGRGCR